MKFGELTKRLQESGIGPDAEIVAINIESAVAAWMPPGPQPPAAPGASKPQEGMTLVIRA